MHLCERFGSRKDISRLNEVPSKAVTEGLLIDFAKQTSPPPLPPTEADRIKYWHLIAAKKEARGCRKLKSNSRSISLQYPSTIRNRALVIIQTRKKFSKNILSEFSAGILQKLIFKHV